MPDRGENAPETLDFSNDLITTMNIGAMIPTGMHTGHGRARATTTTGTPEMDKITEWEEAIEASVHGPHGQLRVETP
jgi:hypothetical protein